MVHKCACAVLVVLLCAIGCSARQDDTGPAETPTTTVVDRTWTGIESSADAGSPVPVSISIDSIGVTSELMRLGLQPDGSMEVPPGAFPAGWYNESPSPGELGPAVIAGHVDWAGEPGVFSDLTSLEPADTIDVTREDGSVATFRVTSVEQYDKDEFPTGSVYGDLDHSGLRLITCGGDFDEGASSYDDNIVAYADLIGIA